LKEQKADIRRDDHEQEHDDHEEYDEDTTRASNVTKRLLVFVSTITPGTFDECMGSIIVVVVSDATSHQFKFASLECSHEQLQQQQE
jgi:hypothetical protein